MSQTGTRILVFTVNGNILLMYQGPTLHQSVYLEISPPHTQGVRCWLNANIANIHHGSAFEEHTGCCDDRCRRRDQKRTLMPLVLTMMTRPLIYGQNLRISNPR